MECDEKLPLELVWRDDGHLTEVALTVMADGELSLLPGDAAPHASHCATCASALGAAALLSLRVGGALGAHSVVAASSADPFAAPTLVTSALAAPALVASSGTDDLTTPAHASKAPLVPSATSSPPSALAVARPLPLMALLASLGLATIAATPRLSTLEQDAQSLGRSLLMLTRLARTVVASDSFASHSARAPLQWLSALLLLVFGLVVARAARSRILVEQGEQG
ncbi:hypothetical protein [Chondromyces crocatus]|nr:hypothetical protein [Chondromyces crocatus]